MNPEKIAHIESAILEVFINHPSKIDDVKLFQSGSNTLNFTFATESSIAPIIQYTDEFWIKFQGYLKRQLNKEGYGYFDVSITSTNIVLFDPFY